MKELVRCKACGFVMEAGKFDVCPACGLSSKVFEPYRERVAINRLFVLSLDLHPIAIHLSQSFIFFIPALMMFTYLFPDVEPALFGDVLTFAIFGFPLTLIAAVITGVIDGLFRFKSLKPPLLRLKIIFSICIILLAFTMLFVAKSGKSDLVTFLLSLGCLYFAVRLGLLGKKLLNVILPGMYPVKKVKKPGEKAAVAPQ